MISDIQGFVMHRVPRGSDVKGFKSRARRCFLPLIAFFLEKIKEAGREEGGDRWGVLVASLISSLDSGRAGWIHAVCFIRDRL